MTTKVQTSIAEEDIPLCPFCGRDAELYLTPNGYLFTCGCQKAVFGEYGTTETEAAKSWLRFVSTRGQG